LTSRLKDKVQPGYILNTQNWRHFTDSNIPSNQFKIFDNEVYEFKHLKTLIVYEFSDTYVKNEVYEWLDNHDIGIWVMKHCKNIYFEISVVDNSMFF